MNEQPADPARPPALERAVAVALRTVHLLAVVGLGAALLGAPLARGPQGAALLASGLVLFALDLRAGRMRAGETAGAVVIVKLAASAWIALGLGGELPLFWLLVVVSSLSSHAPKSVRHWRPGLAKGQADDLGSARGGPR